MSVPITTLRQTCSSTSQKIKDDFKRFGTELKAGAHTFAIWSKKTFEKSVTRMSKVAWRVEALEKFAKFYVAAEKVRETLKIGPVTQGTKFLRSEVKNFAEMADALNIFGRVYDWVCEPAKQFDSPLQFMKTSLLTIGHTAGFIKWLGNDLDLIKLGRVANPTFSYGFLKNIPGIALLKDIPIGLASIISNITNGKWLSKKKPKIKYIILPNEMKKWKAKTELLDAAKGNDYARLEVLKQEYIAARQSLGVTKRVLEKGKPKTVIEKDPIIAAQKIEDKWEFLVKEASDPAKHKQLKDLREWKLKCWKTEKYNFAIKNEKAIVSVIYDSFKIVLISANVFAAYVFPVSQNFFTAFGFCSAYLGLHKVLIIDERKRPSRPYPKPPLSPVTAPAKNQAAAAA